MNEQSGLGPPSKDGRPPAAPQSPADTDQPLKLPAGRPPWDPWNGLRVGALTGGIVGVLVAVGLSITPLGPVLFGAVGGGVVGYRSEKRKQSNEPIPPSPRRGPTS